VVVGRTCVSYWDPLVMFVNTRSAKNTVLSDCDLQINATARHEHPSTASQHDQPSMYGTRLFQETTAAGQRAGGIKATQTSLANASAYLTSRSHNRRQTPASISACMRSVPPSEMYDSAVTAL
jgi:hypothetical protein